ncbi:MAG: hypothetical protein GY765_42650, partial [bacterium]|nr:hypothetical protein [bacterium]
MIKRKIIKLEATDFRTGRLVTGSGPGKESCTFLLDTGEKKMLCCDGDFQTVESWDLTQLIDGLKGIDAVFFNGTFLLITDFQAKVLYRLPVQFDPDGGTTIGEAVAFPMPEGAVLVSIIPIDDTFVFLDKGRSLLRIYDKNLAEVRTAGSRMGYIMEEDKNPRLGFEFPEDMLVMGDRLLVSDSGNKRLVVIDRNEWKQLKTIHLPEYPYKFVSCDGDMVVVSDFDRSLMTVSLTYGFVCIEEMDYPVDFSNTLIDGKRTLTGSEKTGELVELEIAMVPLEEMAREAENWTVLTHLLSDANCGEEAREIVLSQFEAVNQKWETADITAVSETARDNGTAVEPGARLLLDYAAYTGDVAVDNALKLLAEHVAAEVSCRKGNIKKEVSVLSFDFITKYKSIPTCEDKEAGNIDKAHIGHRIFGKLKEYRALLNTLAGLRQVTANFSESAGLLEQLLQPKALRIRLELEETIQAIKENLVRFNEHSLLEAIVEYWFLAEEKKILFKQIKVSHEWPFEDKFLVELLDHFNFTVAMLFLNAGKEEEFIMFCDREITMYPDKMGIFKKFITELMKLKKYDDVLRMLNKFPDTNKEGINYFYYQVYRLRANRDKAFLHLKKELELFPHRLELIPQLISLN